MRAFSIGASTVLSSVWPDLKSLPAMGTPAVWASSTIAGTSTVRLGAPLMKGAPSLSAAYA